MTAQSGTKSTTILLMRQSNFFNDAYTSNCTLLSVVVRYQPETIIKRLVERGGDVSTRDSTEKMPLTTR
jgi:hypothetical protein